MKSFGQRLNKARKMNGLSMQDLANRMNNIVTKQAIGKYEQGDMKPSSEILIALSNVLNVRPDYFYRSEKIKLENIEFRKLKRLSAKDIDQIKANTVDFLERYFELEGLLGIDKPFKNPISNILIKSGEDIELATSKLREKWDIGTNSIPNVIELLEDHEIKVFEIDVEDGFDGLSTYANGVPTIVLNKNMQKFRKRFTALHELAHLLLKFPDNTFEEKEIEKLCHSFAGAMLIPKQVFIDEFGAHRSNVFIKELMIMKENFGISMQAIMARARNLDLISQSTYQEFFKTFSKLGYRKKEPGDYKGDESGSRFFQLLLRAVAEEIVSMSKAAALSNQKLAEFRNHLNEVEA